MSNTDRFIPDEVFLLGEIKRLKELLNKGGISDGLIITMKKYRKNLKKELLKLREKELSRKYVEILITMSDDNKLILSLTIITSSKTYDESLSNTSSEEIVSFIKSKVIKYTNINLGLHTLNEIEKSVKDIEIKVISSYKKSIEC